MAAVLSESGMVTPDALMAGERICTLSEHGTLLFQQRLVWAMTHAKIELDTLAEFSAPAFAELELLEYWNELLYSDVEPDERADALAQIAAAFEEYIRTTGLQKQLEQDETRGDARREIRREARRRQRNGRDPRGR